MRTLIIDSEERKSRYIRNGLRESGFVVDIANSGRSGILYYKENHYDLVIVDINTPDMNGQELLKTLRKLGDSCILVLTAENQLSERLKLFDLGADDFLIKPFHFPELLARVHALLRRPAISPTYNSLRVGDLTLDPVRRQAQRGERRLHLSVKEFALLHLLMRHKGKVVPRRRIISSLWDSDSCYSDAAVSVAVCRLRAQVDGPFATPLIHTQRGVGYIIEERAPTAAAGRASKQQDSSIA